MTVFIVVSIIVLVGVAVAATLGRFGHTDLQMHPPASSVGGWGTDDEGAPTPLYVRDLEDIRFDTALRGYRMDQVDAMIARLQAGEAVTQVAEAAQPEAADAGGGAGSVRALRDLGGARALEHEE